MKKNYTNTELSFLNENIIAKPAKSKSKKITYIGGSLYQIHKYQQN